jgi:hypothetical protein
MKHFIQMMLLGFLSMPAFAQIDQPKEIQTSQKFGNYTVHYNVFNSTSIPPQVAETYKLVRGKDRALVNISLTKTDKGSTSLGLPAVVVGVTRNLMQQQQNLKFIEIKEGEATYYLAPFVFNNEELLHFEVQVIGEAENRPLKVSFSRTLYTD